MKALAARAAALLARLGVLRALESVDRATDRVGILTYHRIDELGADPDLDPALISATPAEFRAQLELIASRFHAISLADLLSAHLERRPLPPRSVLLTFDDGYRDFVQHAWPALRDFGLPAVLFVPTAFPDAATRGFWWDRLHAALARTPKQALEADGIDRLPIADGAQRRAALRRLKRHVKSLPHAEALAFVDRTVERLAEVPPLHRVLGWDALRTLAGEGLDVCSHGEAHALFTRLSPRERADDLARSKARLEAELGRRGALPVLAYPSSACDGAVCAAARDADYALALGGRRGFARLPLENPFNLMRLPVLRYGVALFRAQLRPVAAGLGRRLAAGRA